MRKSDGKRETFLTNVVKAFESNLLYEAIKISEDTFRLQYRKIGVFTNIPEITSYYPNSFSFSAFSGGVDNSRLLAKTLKSGEAIGVWLQKTPASIANIHDTAYYLDLFDKFQDNKFNPVQDSSANTSKIKFVLEWEK